MPFLKIMCLKILAFDALPQSMSINHITSRSEIAEWLRPLRKSKCTAK